MKYEPLTAKRNVLPLISLPHRCITRFSVPKSSEKDTKVTAWKMPHVEHCAFEPYFMKDS